MFNGWQGEVAIGLGTRRRPGLLAALWLVAASGLGCGGGGNATAPSGEGAPAPPAGDVATPGADAAPWVDAAAASGLDFVHFNGMSGELYYSEMMGPGAAVFDFDDDGDLDVYLLQGHLLNPEKDLADATFPPPPAMLPLRDRLYRNDLETDGDGNRRLRFTDVTEESGLRATGYGMGAATGDFDNDGWIDIYVTNAGSNQLWRNNGRGADGKFTFSDVTAETNTDDPSWSLSAIWIDLDLDGWLDLYVVNYVEFTVAAHRQCRMFSGIPDYCGPQAFAPLPDRLLRNRGRGAGGGVTFEPVGEVAADPGAGMGVAAADVDGDGWLDLYIANDGMANQLWLRRPDGSLHDEALLRGVAFNREGNPEAGMGVVAGDYDSDGDEDLLVTNLALESHTLYRNDSGLFEDVTLASGLGAESWQSTGFGTAWVDYDNDGWLDLLSVNGAVILIPRRVAAGDPHPLGMPNQLFRSLGRETGGSVVFQDVTAAAGEAFRQPAVSRGLAIGDLDNDGDADAVVSNNAGAVQVLLNRVGQDRHWLGLRLLAAAAPRDALGALVEVVRARGPGLWRRVGTGGGYLSAHDPRLLFGLGDDAAVDLVRVHWPGGSIEEFDAPADRYTTLRQGTGRQANDGT